MPAYAPPASTGLTPEQIDFAKRVLSHRTRRTFRKGDTGQTVRAIKIYLAHKGYDPGPLTGKWDTQAQAAFKECRSNHGNAESRATPAVIRSMSKDFGDPGPRPPPRAKVMEASMRPIMPGIEERAAKGDYSGLREALSGVPPASGVGPQEGMYDTEGANFLAGQADRSVAEPEPNMDEPMPEGDPALLGRPALPSAQATPVPDQPMPPMPPDAMAAPPDDAQAPMPPDAGAPMPPPDPAAMAPPDAAGMPPPDEAPIEGGLTGADLVPPDAAGMPPDAAAGMPPPMPAPMPPPKVPDNVNLGDLGTLDPAVRAPDELRRGQSMVPLPRPRPDRGVAPDITGDTGSHTVVIQKGDTLWDIAERELGDPRLWPIIAQANPGIRDPNKIYYGRKLTIPG